MLLTVAAGQLAEIQSTGAAQRRPPCQRLAIAAAGAARPGVKWGVGGEGAISLINSLGVPPLHYRLFIVTIISPEAPRPHTQRSAAPTAADSRIGSRTTATYHQTSL